MDEFLGNSASDVPGQSAFAGSIANATPDIQFASGGNVSTRVRNGKLRQKFTAGPAEQQLIDSALGSAGSFSSAGDAVEQSVFQRGLALLQPILDQRDVSLANRGIPLGSEIQRADQVQQNRGLNDLALGSVTAGANERTRRLNEIMAILTGTQSQAPGAAFDPLGPIALRQAGQAGQSDRLGDFAGGLFAGAGSAAGGAFGP